MRLLALNKLFDASHYIHIIDKLQCIVDTLSVTPAKCRQMETLSGIHLFGFRVTQKRYLKCFLEKKICGEIQKGPPL